MKKLDLRKLMLYGYGILLMCLTVVLINIAAKVREKEPVQYLAEYTQNYTPLEARKKFDSYDSRKTYYKFTVAQVTVNRRWLQPPVRDTSIISEEYKSQ